MRLLGMKCSIFPLPTLLLPPTLHPPLHTITDTHTKQSLLCSISPSPLHSAGFELVDGLCRPINKLIIQFCKNAFGLSLWGGETNFISSEIYTCTYRRRTPELKINKYKTWAWKGQKLHNHMPVCLFCMPTTTDHRLRPSHLMQRREEQRFLSGAY